jgi:spore germination protein GerM
MMKRVLIILLCALLLAGCQEAGRGEGGTPFVFCYPSAGGGETLTEQTVYFSQGLPMLPELVRQYIQSTPPEGAVSAIPDGWVQEAEAELIDGVLTLSFRGEAVTEIRCSLAAACLTRTFSAVDGVRSLRLRLPGREEDLVISQEDLLFSDTAMLPKQEQIVLYYPDENLRYLLRETRTVEAMAAEDKPAYILRQLLESKTHSCIPYGTRLFDVWVERGVCTVDLSGIFLRDLSNDFATVRLAVYSIVNSLTELEEIHTVDLWVAHAPVGELPWLGSGTGLLRDERLIRGEHTGTDATLYAVCGEEDLLVPVPVILSDGSAEALVQSLFSYEMTVGSSFIPRGSKLLSLRMNEGDCVVDLTAEFIDGCADERQEKLALRCLIATLCAHAEVETVELLIEGIAPDFRDEDLQKIHAPSPNWFAQ